MPPLSGFIGKLLVLDALRDHALWVWIWALVLGTSLLAVVGFARAGSVLFWKSHEVQTGTATPIEQRGNLLADQPQPGLALAAIGGMLALIVALTVFSGPTMRLAEATAAQLHDRQAYVAAVLGEPTLALLNPVDPLVTPADPTDPATLMEE